TPASRPTLRIVSLDGGRRREGSPISLEAQERPLAISHDGETLATVTAQRELRLWNLEQGRPLLRLAGHEHAIVVAAFSSGDEILATLGADSGGSELLLWPATARD